MWTFGKTLRACALVVAIWAPSALAVTLTGEVVGVADGDTLTLLTANKMQHRIRIDGIDAPERTQPYSQVSKQSLADMVYGSGSRPSVRSPIDSGVACARSWSTAAT